jgi:hypothetical protein
MDEASATASTTAQDPGASSTADDPTGARRIAVRHFIRHFLEMVVAMVVGMIVLGQVVNRSIAALGWPPLTGRPTLHALVMATNMTIGMSAWMRYRRHGWRSTAEMAASMYVPFLVLLPAVWAGLLADSALMITAHVLMVPAMIGAMLLRPAEYTMDHRAHAAAGTHSHHHGTPTDDDPPGEHAWPGEHPEPGERPGPGGTAG